MQRLWSPWRSKYIESISEKNDGTQKKCIFCEKFSEHDDEKSLVVYRGSLSAIVMNLYPYNSGHLMVVPFAHKGDFEDLTDEENADVMRQVRLAVKLLRMTCHPDGFNFGANLGKVSGAGIAEHVHFHVVPRWNGDTNFMTVLDDTKIISEELQDTYKKFKAALAAMKP
ncbi:MAG TPA: HIT domain-containing protein [Candidatus Acidoferrales bacterium]|nr:HIT domain-containing protein [Candidatus Acidoferrales bacterium]